MQALQKFNVSRKVQGSWNTVFPNTFSINSQSAT
jgi:hypothetical protein